MIILSTSLFCAGPTYPVIFSKDLRGDSGRHVQGVHVVLATRIEHPWGLIADHPENEGASIAGSFDEYASAVSAPAGYERDAITWFGLDKEGQFCTWDGASLVPISEPPHDAGSRMAFQAMLARMGARHDGSGVRMMIDSVQEPFMDAGGMRLN